MSLPDRLTEAERALVLEIQRRHAAGDPPSALLHFLADSGVGGIHLALVMEAAFPTVLRTKAIGVWSAGRRAGEADDALIDELIGPSMPPREPGPLLDMVPPQQTYRDILRSYLRLSLEELGVTHADWPHPVHGLLMETTIPEGSFCLVCMVDGTVNWYSDNGAHTLGAGDHDAVYQAASTLMAGAQHHFQMAQPTRNLVSTPVGHARFYFVLDGETRTYAATEKDMNDPHHPFARFFGAAHEVLAQIRHLEETYGDES